MHKDTNILLRIIMPSGENRANWASMHLINSVSILKPSQREPIMQQIPNISKISLDIQDKVQLKVYW